MNKPFSQACENNRGPILQMLQPLLKGKSHVLEIGSGTGQHAVWFAHNMPSLEWQTSDLKHNHAGIQQWIDAFPAPNLLSPIELDMLTGHWPDKSYDGIYSANTAHIMPWQGVVNMITQGATRLVKGGHFCLYGPMQYEGRLEPQSNRDFDARLRHQASHQGIREFHDINRLAQDANLLLRDDHPMPANNRLLIWRKT